MIREMVDLGFEKVELSHGVKISLVPGIIKAFEEKIVRFSTLHNFCPLPAGVTTAAPNLYQPTSKYANERTSWLKNTQRTLDFAAKVEAPIVVLHCGSLTWIFRNPAGKLAKTITAAKLLPELTNNPSFQRLKEKTLAELRIKKAVFWENLIASLHAIAPYAKERGIKLALENREDYCELPLDCEFDDLFERTGYPEVFGYWHDTGHAELKQRACLTSQKELLQANSARHLGWHLHDVSAEGRDHQCPGTGSVDWSAIRPYARPKDQALVLELSPRLKTEQVLEAKGFIERWLADGQG